MEFAFLVPRWRDLGSWTVAAGRRRQRENPFPLLRPHASLSGSPLARAWDAGGEQKGWLLPWKV